MQFACSAEMCTLLSAADVTVTVHDGQDEHHLQPTDQHTTIPNTFECTIPDGIIEAGKDYRVVVNCGSQSVNVSIAATRHICKCADSSYSCGHQKEYMHRENSIMHYIYIYPVHVYMCAFVLQLQVYSVACL